MRGEEVAEFFQGACGAFFGGCGSDAEVLGGGFHGLLLKVVDKDDGAFRFLEAQERAVEEFKSLGMEFR
jgi:hypothetical protein